jgi:hypothetical protein
MEVDISETASQHVVYSDITSTATDSIAPLFFYFLCGKGRGGVIKYNKDSDSGILKTFPIEILNYLHAEEMRGTQAHIFSLSVGFHMLAMMNHVM